MSLINCEIELDLKCAKNCVISEISRTFTLVDTNANPIDYGVVTATNGLTFQINNIKLYVSVVALTINYDIDFLKNRKVLKEQFLGKNIDLE